MKEIIFDGEQIINATDFKAKADHIIDELYKRVFARLDNYTEEIVNLEGESIKIKVDPTGKKFYKNQINPLLSPTKVANEFNALLRQYIPMNSDEAKSLEPKEYLEAYQEYSRVISYILDYLMSYVPSRQTFCAFCNITNDVYNELLMNPTYSQVFKSFEDSFVAINFETAQAGVIDKTVTLAKLQTRDAGHNLIKNPEIINLSVNNMVDKSQVREKLGKFTAMIDKK